jgi:hypothetical protein
MLDQLDRQLTLLEEYSAKAFDEGRAEYLPDIAGKLRILLVRSRNNTPLLFAVAERLGVVPHVKLDGPPIRPLPGESRPGDEIALDAFFDLQAVTIRTSAGLVAMSKRELIRAWCEQLGGVHEDWAVDEALVNAVRFPVRVGGMQPTVMELLNCARTALLHGKRLVQIGRENHKVAKKDA